MLGNRDEQVVSPQAPGAGRIRDLMFPDPIGAGANPAISLRGRTYGGGVLNGSFNNFGGASRSWFYFNGMDSVTFNAGGGAAGTGGSLSFLNVANVMIRTTRPANWLADDDWNVHRIVWIAAMSQLPTSNNDVGLQLVNSATLTDGILKTNAPGLGFQYNQAGTFTFITNTGAGAVQTVLATNGVGGYQQADFHQYELRIFSALPQADAFVKVLIDSAVVSTVSWAGGTLPVPAGAACGFFPTIFNNATGGGAVATHFLGLQAAPTELATF